MVSKLIKDQSSGGVVNADKEAYLQRIRQKTESEKLKSSGNRLEVLEIQVARLTKQVASLIAKKGKK